MKIVALVLLSSLNSTCNLFGFKMPSIPIYLEAPKKRRSPVQIAVRGATYSDQASNLLSVKLDT